MFTPWIQRRFDLDADVTDARGMSMFDRSDPERRQPSMQTPRCALCEEAALPQYGGYCFRHMGSPVRSGQARRFMAARRA